jgi:glycosyltransferase involved in cell wall biosynthesis
VPLVSVITAVYNGERYLSEAVDSILGQTVADFEFIVVNDGSTDRTAQILGSYVDPRIRILHNQQNVGPAASRNRAIAGARAPYIAIQDADDVALPQRLEKQIFFLEKNPNVALVGSHAVTIDDQGNECGALVYPPADDRGIKWDLLFRNPFIHSSVMLRRSVLNLTGPYTDDPEVCRAFVEDYELTSRINRVAQSANIQEPLEKYRLNPMGASSRTCSEQQRLADEVSKRNICWLLDLREMDPHAWRGLRGFSLNWAPLRAHEARAAFALNEAIHEAFASRYPAPDAAREHRRRCYLQWARRAFAHARRNPNLDPNCRAVMLIAAAKLLAAAWHPGVLSLKRI